ncbi:MAG TPA: HAMP domain-containing sensor histidine kinase, partial [Ktedonobacteraceae bacterium]|nr:HAMP domain-containing sensor histidine kinase [Ktedonobacteraceae bacterium]
SLLPATLPPALRRYGTLAEMDGREIQALLHEEAVRALCDIACRSGRVQLFNGSTDDKGAHSGRHIAIAPVESSAGLMGYLMFVATTTSGFSPGEVALVQQELPLLRADMESALRVFVLDYLLHARGHSATEQHEDWQQNIAQALSSVSMVSHELRTPLTAIKGYAGLLQAYGTSALKEADAGEVSNVAGRENGEVSEGIDMTPARQHRYLDMILEEAQRLEVLIADLLDVSRLQSGQLALRYKQVDVRELCSRAVSLARMRLGQHSRVTLHCELPASLPSFQTDPNRLLQVLNNLLENAVKYSPKGGRVELIVRPDMNERRITFTVRDQGIGIPATQQARLFKPFSRVESPQTRQVQGAGLGLYITSMLAKVMRGTIELTSGEGIGTSVSVSFLLQSPEQPVECSDATFLPVQGATPVHVLSV